MSIMTILIILFVVAQFHPKGQAFLASEVGSVVTVALAALAIIGMLPGLLLGNILNLLFIGLWVWVAYPRLPIAKAWLVRKIARR